MLLSIQDKFQYDFYNQLSKLHFYITILDLINYNLYCVTELIMKNLPEGEITESSHKIFAYKIPALILLFLIQLLILFMYGFYSEFTTTQSTPYLSYILTNMLAALGFGLLLCYFRIALKQSLIITLFVISFNAQFGPLLQKFWFNVFINGFGNSGNQIPQLQNVVTENNKMQLSYTFVRISTFCSISLLAALSAVIGRIGIFSLALTTIVFNIGYFLSYYLNMYIHLVNQSNQQNKFFDDFQTSRVFMFASGFGLALMLVYSKIRSVPSAHNKNYPNQDSCLPLFMGVFITIASWFFMCDEINTSETSLLNIFFALSASIMTSIGLSCIINEQLWLKDLALSIFSGAIQIGIIIKLINHPFVAIAIGGFAGLSGTFLLNFFNHRLNNNKVRDSLGLFSTYFLNSILAVFLVSPIVIRSYNTNYNETNVANYDWNQGIPMIYASISLGIGFIFGVLAGLFRICIKETPVFSDYQFFGPDYIQEYPQQEQQIKPSIKPKNVGPIDKTIGESRKIQEPSRTAGEGTSQIILF